MSKNINNENTVLKDEIYIVMRNTDSIEGKGVDYIEKIFKTKKEALNYIESEIEQQPNVRCKFEWNDHITERYECGYSIQIYAI